MSRKIAAGVDDVMELREPWVLVGAPVSLHIVAFASAKMVTFRELGVGMPCENKPANQ